MSTLKVTNITPQSGNTVYLTGSLEISNTLIAKEIRTELTQSVTLFQSGSSQFGDTVDDTHTFVGGVDVSGSLAVEGTYSNQGDLKVTGSLLLSGSKLEVTGSSVELLVNWPPSPNEFHFLQTDPFTVNLASGNRTYEYAAWALDHNEYGAGVYHNAFKWYMYDSPAKDFGNEMVLGPTLTRFLILASGSASTANLTIRDLTDGTTSIQAVADFVNIGKFGGDVTITGELTTSYTLTASGSISCNSSISSLNGITAGGGFTGSADFDTLVNKPTLISSSAQLALDISGSFTSTSSSFSSRVTSLETFSSSLDSTYATDAQVATATASLSSSLATDIATNLASVVSLTAATSSYASTGSNTFTGNQVVSASVLLTLQQLTGSMPTGVATGSLIVSGSPVQLYIYNGSGSGWNRV